MPQKITNDAGEEVEVFTANELQAQTEAALNAFKQANPDKSDEITKLQGELDRAKKAVEGFQDKDMNMKAMREAKEAAEKKVEDIKKEFESKLDTTKKEILEGVAKDHYNDTLNSLASGDDELKKKIEFQYKRLTDPAATKEEVTKKITDAYILATGKPVDDGVLNSTITSSGGVSRPKFGTNQQFTAEEKALAQKLAQAGGMKLDEKDFK